MLVLVDYIHNVRVTGLDYMVVNNEPVLINPYRTLNVSLVILFNELDDIRRNFQGVLSVKVI